MAMFYLLKIRTSIDIFKIKRVKLLLALSISLLVSLGSISVPFTCTYCGISLVKPILYAVFYQFL